MKLLRLTVFFGLFLFVNLKIQAQTVIGLQNYDAGTPVMSVTTTGGVNITGSSAVGDRPASSTFFTSSTTAYSVTNTTGTATYANMTGLASYNSKYFEFNLAAFSISSTGNGMDAADLVTVAVSINGGAFSNEIIIAGNSNAYWHYSSGTGVATTTYTGTNTPANFSPAGGGARTTDGFGLVHVNLPNACSSAQLRITLLNNATGEKWTIDDVKLVGTLVAPCVIGAAPTTNSTSATATPTCTTANLNFTPGNGGNRIVVVSTSPIASNPVNATNYSSNSTFGLGSTLGAGEFIVFNGNGSSVNISGLSATTTYFYSIFEYNGIGTNCDESYLTSSPLSGTFTTQTTCGPTTPQVRAILADACGLSEGTDELVIIENGNSPLSLSNMNIAFPSGGTYCNSGCGANTLLNNATYVNSLNTQAGCTLFYFADPIPAGAIIVLFCGNPPSTVFDYSSLCPSTLQYYAVFCNNTSTTGRFANSAAAGVTRTLTCTFNGTNESVTYEPNSLPGDGSFVYFDDPGNATYQLTTNCIFPLGVELMNFSGAKEKEDILLQWTTATETGSDRFEVNRINPTTLEYTKIGTVYAAGNSSETLHYSFTDQNPQSGVNYYRLNQIDRDGESTWSSVIAVNMDLNEQVISYNDGVIQFSEVLNSGTEYEIIGTNGQFISKGITEQKTIQIQETVAPGIWYIRLTERNGKISILKFVALN